MNETLQLEELLLVLLLHLINLSLMKLALLKTAILEKENYLLLLIDGRLERGNCLNMLIDQVILLLKLTLELSAVVHQVKQGVVRGSLLELSNSPLQLERVDSGSFLLQNMHCFLPPEAVL